MSNNIKLHQKDLPEDLDLGNVLAIDGEFMGLNVRRDPLCLMQICSGNSDAHIVQFERNNYNAPNLIKILNDDKGPNFGARNITVSTVGLVPQILRLADEKIQINLAVSIHAPDNKTRSETVPINKRYPIEMLIDACKEYIKKTFIACLNTSEVLNEKKFVKVFLKFSS